MPTKKELEEQIVKLETDLAELNQHNQELRARIDNTALAEIVASAPTFPINYDDGVLAIEEGFKPAYNQFLLKLIHLVEGR